MLLRNTSSRAEYFKLLIINSELGDCVTTKCALNSTLWIFNTTMDDVGKYTCNASNIAGNSTTSVQLSVAIGNSYKNKLCIFMLYGMIYNIYFKS